MRGTHRHWAAAAAAAARQYRQSGSGSTPTRPPSHRSSPPPPRRYHQRRQSWRLHRLLSEHWSGGRTIMGRMVVVMVAAPASGVGAMGRINA
jgi:hypothetical protein